MDIYYHKEKIENVKKIEFINQCYAPEVQDQLYTIEMPYAQPSNDDQSTTNVRDKPPPSYETVEISVPSK